MVFLRANGRVTRSVYSPSQGIRLALRRAGGGHASRPVAARAPLRPMLATQWADQAPKCTTPEEAVKLMGVVLDRHHRLEADQAQTQSGATPPSGPKGRIPLTAQLRPNVRLCLRNVQTAFDLERRVHLPPYFVSPKYDGVRCVALMEYRLTKVVGAKELIRRRLRRLSSVPKDEEGAAEESSCSAPNGGAILLSDPDSPILKYCFCGARCGVATWWVHEVTLRFECRTGAKLKHLTRQGNELAQLMLQTVLRNSPKTTRASMILDGELCARRRQPSDGEAVPGERLRFEEALSAVRSAMAKRTSDAAKAVIADMPFKVFDVVEYSDDWQRPVQPRSTPFPERWYFLKSLPVQQVRVGGSCGRRLVSLVKHVVVHDFRLIRRSIGPAIIRRLKVEGVVVRTAANVYEPGQRSPTMFKLVPWKSSEFAVLGFHAVGATEAVRRRSFNHKVKQQRRSGATHTEAHRQALAAQKGPGDARSRAMIGSIECVTDRGRVFRVPGTNIAPAAQQDWWANRDKYIGALATIEYHSLHPASGIPRHPFIKSLRTSAEGVSGSVFAANPVGVSASASHRTIITPSNNNAADYAFV